MEATRAELTAAIIALLVALLAACGAGVAILCPPSAAQFPKIPMEIVVARYAENLDWLNEPPFAGHVRTVYDKSAQVRNGPGVVALPNVGRCDHTYLWHTVARYDTLADVTMFLPGSASDAHKWPKAVQIMNEALRSGNSEFWGVQVDGLLQDDVKGFYLNSYSATNPSNLAANPEKDLLLASPRPFEPWFRKHVAVDPALVQMVTYLGIFAVSRADVHRKPKRYYENLLRQVSGHTNPEAGHFTERSWAAIFGETKK